jgi:predicted protein tyrosine phosphatase
MRDLFVCLAGKNRSPLAVEIAKRLAFEKRIKGYEATSLGIAYAKTNSFEGYDRIFVMNSVIRKEMIDKYKVSSCIIDLDVQDAPINKGYILISELEEKLKPFF